VSVSAVAFVPSAPLLVPALAGGSAVLDEALRAASRDVVTRALRAGPDEILVVATTSPAGQWPREATWDFSGFGVPRRPIEPRPTLPWALGIGAWLLDECGWDGARRYVGVDWGSLEAPELGEPRADRTTSILVVGDGSACRSERAPGHLDARAEPFDDAVADLLRRGDANEFAAIERGAAVELMCGGLPAWCWAAAQVERIAVASAELVSHTAPYGVGYFVAFWSLD
jgi:hypothetical protein